MKVVVAGGFAALIITMIGCTYILHGAIKRYSFDGGDIVSTIEHEGNLTRDAIRGKPKPAEPDAYPTWFNK